MHFISIMSSKIILVSGLLYFMNLDSIKLNITTTKSLYLEHVSAIQCSEFFKF